MEGLPARSAMWWKPPDSVHEHLVPCRCVKGEQLSCKRHLLQALGKAQKKQLTEFKERALQGMRESAEAEAGASDGKDALYVQKPPLKIGETVPTTDLGRNEFGYFL